MIKLNVCTLLILMYSLGIAQQESDILTIEKLREIYKGIPYEGYGYPNDGTAVDGTPLLFEELRAGKIQLKQKEANDDTLSIAIDLERDYVVFKTTDGTYGFLPGNILQEITLFTPSNRIFRPYNSGTVANATVVNTQLYEVLFDQNDILLLKHQDRYVEKPEDKAGVQLQLSEPLPIKYKTSVNYFISIDGVNYINKFKLNKRSIVKNLRSQYPDIAKQIKAENVVTSAEEGVVDLLNSFANNK